VQATKANAELVREVDRLQEELQAEKQRRPSGERHRTAWKSAEKELRDLQGEKGPGLRSGMARRSRKWTAQIARLDQERARLQARCDSLEADRDRLSADKHKAVQRRQKLEAQAAIDQQELERLRVPLGEQQTKIQAFNVALAKQIADTAISCKLAVLRKKRCPLEHRGSRPQENHHPSALPIPTLSYAFRNRLEKMRFDVISTIQISCVEEVSIYLCFETSHQKCVARCCNN
jgi:chromosome segregation ATPase